MTHQLLRALLSTALLAGATTLAQGQAPCGDWTVIPVPVDPSWNRSVFEDVSALDDGSAWAVGYAQLPTPPYGPENVTLAMRYANGQWEHTPTPYVSTWVGGANDFLHAVAAIAPDDVWAAGERHGDAGGASVGAWVHALHWDGSSWSEMPVPAPPGGVGINFSGTRIYDIADFASDDVWFGGQWGEPNAQFSVTWRPLAMHWDGSGMTVYPTPTLYSGTNAMHMRQMAFTGPHDIWGICRTNTAGGVTHEPTLLHYDGSAWTQVATPSLGTSVVLDDIVATAPNDVWVFGHTYYPSTPFALHWDGSSFSVVSGVPYATTATAQAPGEIYLGTSTIELFDGTGSTVVETFAGVNSPSVLGMDSRGSCNSWAVGRRWEAGSDLAPLAAVMTSSTVGSAFCFGDGSGTTCPCGNAGASGEGCRNSTGSGAMLEAVGSNSVAAADLVLLAEQLAPQQAGLYFQGTGAVNGGSGAIFGDGLRCAGGTVARLRVRMADAAGHSSLAVLPTAGGGVSAGDLRRYQLWYRDTNGSPCGSGFNTTNGVEIVWAP